MGKLGFAFKVIREKDEIIFLNDKILSKSKIVVFIEKENLNGNYVAGLDQFLKEDDCEFLYLSKDLSLKPFLVFEKSKFLYAKISLYEKTELDYNSLTFWFGIRKYKHIWDLMTLDFNKNIEEEISKRVVKISEIFK